MKRSQIYIGVDVSKSTLDICVNKHDKLKFSKIPNDADAIKKFFIDFQRYDALIVFEATGSYSYTLGRILTDLRLNYSELNPLKVSHFLKYYSRSKTDKKDAQALAAYASLFYNDLTPGSFSQRDAEIRVYRSYLRLLGKIKTQLNNFNESLFYNPALKDKIAFLLAQINSDKQAIEALLFDLVCDIIPQTKQIITDNKGFGTSLAVYLFPILHFNKDKTHKQIVSYLGLAPRLAQSGSSVHKMPCINRMGSSELRSILFMSALVCVRFNPYFKDYYEKMINRNKPKKVALVAVCNKIVKYLKSQYFND